MMKANIMKIKMPLTDDAIKNLHAGQMVYIYGDVYTARDAAHKRLFEMLENGEKMPFDFAGNMVFYAGPAPAKPDDIMGAIGPTTAGRMDLYSPRLIEAGLKCMLGKGLRSKKTIEAIKEHNGIYFAGIGGVATLMSRAIRSVELVAFEDLGTEAIRKLRVEGLPAIVAVDCYGQNVYELRNKI